MIQLKLRLSEAAYRYQIQFNHRHPCSVVDYVTNFPAIQSRVYFKAVSAIVPK